MLSIKVMYLLSYIRSNSGEFVNHGYRNLLAIKVLLKFAFGLWVSVFNRLILKSPVNIILCSLDNLWMSLSSSSVKRSVEVPRDW